MINRPEHDNCMFHAPTPDCNPNNERSQTPNYIHEKHKVKTGLSHLFFSRLFGAFHLTVVIIPIIADMKERFTHFIGGLEKTLESCKTHWKEIVTAIALPFIFSNNVEAGRLNTYCASSITRPSIGVAHVSEAREPEEGYESNGNDARFNDNTFPPTIDFYSKIDFDPYKLKKDSRPPESMTRINAEISGRGLSAPENAQLQFTFYDIGENNFSWKNIIGELSQRVDDGDGGYKYALIGNYDIKNLVNSARTLPISVENGVTQGDVFFPSHKLDYSFFHYADFNRDRRIDGLDFEIFRENFNRNNETDPNTFGSYVGSEPNNYNAYADIDRNGSVGLEDLDIFKSYFKFSGDLNSDGRVGMDDFAYLANDWNIGDANFYDLGAFAGDYLRNIDDPGTW